MNPENLSRLFSSAFFPWKAKITLQRKTTQARKKSTKINLMGPERLPGGVRVFQAKGCGSKSSCPPSNVPDPWGVRKVCAKKVSAHFSFPNNLTSAAKIITKNTFQQ